MGAPKGHAPYPGCETGGRPKKYTEEYINAEADALIKWTKASPGNIFLEEFCLERDYHETRIHQFCKWNKKFLRAYNQLKMKQKLALKKGSLSRKFAHPMCALILAVTHKYQSNASNANEEHQKQLSQSINNIKTISYEPEPQTSDELSASDEEIEHLDRSGEIGENLQLDSEIDRCDDEWNSWGCDDHWSEQRIDSTEHSD